MKKYSMNMIKTINRNNLTNLNTTIETLNLLPCILQIEILLNKALI